jgi:hypothetical protein
MTTLKSGADLPAQGSHLFILRIWQEDLGSGKTDWRGKIQHVNSGEARYFRDWPGLEAFLENQLHFHGSNPSTTGKVDENP